MERGFVIRSNVTTKHALELTGPRQSSGPFPEAGVTSGNVLEITRTHLEKKPCCGSRIRAPKPGFASAPKKKFAVISVIRVTPLPALNKICSHFNFFYYALERNVEVKIRFSF